MVIGGLTLEKPDGSPRRQTAYTLPAPAPPLAGHRSPRLGAAHLFRSLPPYLQQDLGQSVETLGVPGGTQAVLAESLSFRARCSTSQSWAIAFRPFIWEIFTGG